MHLPPRGYWSCFAKLHWEDNVLMTQIFRNQFCISYCKILPYLIKPVFCIVTSLWIAWDFSILQGILPPRGTLSSLSLWPEAHGLLLWPSNCEVGNCLYFSSPPRAKREPPWGNLWLQQLNPVTPARACTRHKATGIPTTRIDLQP